MRHLPAPTSSVRPVGLATLIASLAVAACGGPTASSPTPVSGARSSEDRSREAPSSETPAGERPSSEAPAGERPSSEVSIEPPALHLRRDGLIIRGTGFPAVSTDGAVVVALAEREEGTPSVGGHWLGPLPVFDLDWIELPSGTQRAEPLVTVDLHTVHEQAAVEACEAQGHPDGWICEDDEILARYEAERDARLDEAVARANAALEQRSWRSLVPVTERAGLRVELAGPGLRVVRADGSTALEVAPVEIPDNGYPHTCDLEEARVFADPGSELVLAAVPCRRDDTYLRFEYRIGTGR